MQFSLEASRWSGDTGHHGGEVAFSGRLCLLLKPRTMVTLSAIVQCSNVPGYSHWGWFYVCPNIGYITAANMLKPTHFGYSGQSPNQGEKCMYIRTLHLASTITSITTHWLRNLLTFWWVLLQSPLKVLLLCSAHWCQRWLLRSSVHYL